MLQIDAQTVTKQAAGGHVEVQLKESDHMVALRLANVVKNWTNKQTVSQNLPDFIAGLNRIGSFDLTGAEQTQLTKLDGSQVPDPRDDILVGGANETDTLEFVLSRIFQMDVSGMRLGKSDEDLVKLYSQYREKLVAIKRARYALQFTELNVLKSTMRDESKSNEEYVEKLREWSFSTGSYFEGKGGLNDQQLAKDKKILPKVRALISSLSTGTPLSE